MIVIPYVLHDIDDLLIVYIIFCKLHVNVENNKHSLSLSLSPININVKKHKLKLLKI